MQIEQEFALRARGRLRAGAARACFGMVRAAAGGGIGAHAVSGSLFSKMFARADNSKTFIVEKALDFKNCFNILAAIQPMAAGTFYRL